MQVGNQLRSTADQDCEGLDKSTQVTERHPGSVKPASEHRPLMFLSLLWIRSITEVQYLISLTGLSLVLTAISCQMRSNTSSAPNWWLPVVKGDTSSFYLLYSFLFNFIGFIHTPSFPMQPKSFFERLFFFLNGIWKCAKKQGGSNTLWFLKPFKEICEVSPTAINVQ